MSSPTTELIRAVGAYLDTQLIDEIKLAHPKVGKAPKDVEALLWLAFCYDELDNFDPAEHTNATDTEHSAAVIARRSSTPSAKRALEFIVSRGAYGATDYEGSALAFFSFPKRRVNLYRAGLVKDSGKRRETPRKSKAIVWVRS